MLDDPTIMKRQPLWTAISELWLDTEISRSDIERIASAAIASQYSTRELNAIYLYEVAPVVGSNLLTPAGAWNGFDQDWLHIEARNRAEHRSLWLLFWMWSGIGRKLLTYATQTHWEDVIAMVEQVRADAPSISSAE